MFSHPRGMMFDPAAPTWELKPLPKSDAFILGAIRERAADMANQCGQLKEELAFAITSMYMETYAEHWDGPKSEMVQEWLARLDEVLPKAQTAGFIMRASWDDTTQNFLVTNHKSQ